MARILAWMGKITEELENCNHKKGASGKVKIG
jgi:hypothetical protein